MLRPWGPAETARVLGHYGKGDKEGDRDDWGSIHLLRPGTTAPSPQLALRIAFQEWEHLAHNIKESRENL